MLAAFWGTPLEQLLHLRGTSGAVGAVCFWPSRANGNHENPLNIRWLSCRGRVIRSRW
jgi:hypothetical protein